MDSNNSQEYAQLTGTRIHLPINTPSDVSTKRPSLLSETNKRELVIALLAAVMLLIFFSGGTL